MNAIIFSKDRAAQLDLLLRSMSLFVPELFTITTVLWTASNPDSLEGYRVCAKLHEDVVFYREWEFPNDVRVIIGRSDDYVAFFCDDDVFFSTIGEPRPETVLEWNRHVLTVSMRLGTNTTRCYSLDINQGMPSLTRNHRDVIFWNWRKELGDWGYPGSLDGNVWRKEEIKILLDESVATNPNELEEELSLACHKALLPEMACYTQSCVVGNAVNIVNTTHRANRHGREDNQSAEHLNKTFLDGSRLSTSSVNPGLVRAAHCEQPLVWLINTRDMSHD